MRLNYQLIGWRAAVLRQLDGLDQKQAAARAGIPRLPSSARCDLKEWPTPG